MKRLNIVVEGQTEQSFVNEVLAPHLRNNGVSLIIPRLIRTSKTGRGGLVNYHHLHNTIKGLLSNQSSAEAFLEQFKSIPKDMSLLKNFRHALYEHDDKEKQRRLEQERRLQMERINRAKQSAGRGSR